MAKQTKDDLAGENSAYRATLEKLGDFLQRHKMIRTSETPVQAAIRNLKKLGRSN